MHKSCILPLLGWGAPASVCLLSHSIYSCTYVPIIGICMSSIGTFHIMFLWIEYEACAFSRFTSRNCSPRKSNVSYLSRPWPFLGVGTVYTDIWFALVLSWNDLRGAKLMYDHWSFITLAGSLPSKNETWNRTQRASDDVSFTKPAQFLFFVPTEVGLFCDFDVFDSFFLTHLAPL